MSAPVGVVMRRGAELAASRERVFCAGCGKTRPVNHPCPSRDHPSRKPRSRSKPVPPPSSFYQWWLDRYTIEEIQGLAADLERFLRPRKSKPAERTLTDALPDGLNQEGV